MLDKLLHEIPQPLAVDYSSLLESLHSHSPDLGIARTQVLDPRAFGYDAYTFMHEVSFTDGTDIYSRLRRFREPGYLKWDTIHTAEHVIWRPNTHIPRIMLHELIENVYPALTPRKHDLQTKIGTTEYGAVVVYSSSGILPTADSDLVRGTVEWNIQSVKNIIPRADEAAKKWFASLPHGSH